MLGLIDDAERVVRDDSVYQDSDGKPSKDRYWAHMEQLHALAPDYRSMLENNNLLDDARQLAVSDSQAEVGSLVVAMLTKLLPPPKG